MPTSTNERHLYSSIVCGGTTIGYPQVHTCNSEKPFGHRIPPFPYSLLLPDANNGFDGCRSKSLAKSPYMIVSCRVSGGDLVGRQGQGDVVLRDAGRGLRGRVFPGATRVPPRPLPHLRRLVPAC